MTESEKHTFKNPEIERSVKDGIKLPSRSIQTLFLREGTQSGHFTLNEWDIKITLKRVKKVPFKPGYYRDASSSSIGKNIYFFTTPPRAPEHWRRVNVSDDE